MDLADYCKAVDTVGHERLLQKLKIYGVENNAINCFKSNLVNRHKLVSISGKTFGMALMKHGVPQCSILEPLLFLVLIDDLSLHVSASIDQYADDTTVTSSVEYDSIPYLQANVTLLGSELDDKLSFHFHVDQLCKKLSRGIAVLRKIRSYLSLQQKIFSYNLMICLVINYVTIIWTTYTKENQERVFKF